jgi:hypothetical protein
VASAPGDVCGASLAVCGSVLFWGFEVGFLLEQAFAARCSLLHLVMWFQ